MKKQKSLLGATSLRERYEKKLWSLILEDDGDAKNITPDKIKETLQDIAKKITEAGLENPLKGATEKLGEILMKSSQEDDTKEVSIDDLKKLLEEFNSSEIGFEYWNFVIPGGIPKNPESEEPIRVIDDFSESLNNESIDIKSGIEKVVSSLNKLIEMQKSKGDLPEGVRNYPEEIKKMLNDFLGDEEKVPLETIGEAINLFYNKIKAVIDAYGKWLKENKEQISNILEMIEAQKTTGPSSQNAGYRRLGNTLFERFLMSGGLR